MKTDSIKRWNFAFAISALVSGCLALIVGTILIYSIARNILEVKIDSFIIFCAIVCVGITITMLYIAINLFIKYGMTLGIDEALDKQKEETRGTMG